MTQIEFENQMRELRTQKGAELKAIAKMQGEVKEEIAAIDRQVKELRAKREKLNQQRIMIANRRLDMEGQRTATPRLHGSADKPRKGRGVYDEPQWQTEWL